MTHNRTIQVNVKGYKVKEERQSVVTVYERVYVHVYVYICMFTYIRFSDS